ncbi:hypothetical protein BGZ61DRAFT_526472 [Ilyonectria robusta]|uniref:uncharacterized protein n=1 Tax=Ilyonectria robusta TaxID=1079257 RepID=UPI001E8E6B03|nr:uncharacterized protein BGZ61DRAFT_526472 [Ilyonectria robusta]KAH8735374.1 hypothetical protein BGZ61DRAFT_526472 [Ilyonectria robusta]
MSSRKRSLQAVDGDSGDSEPSLLHRIRNMWQFANLCQWIYTFGKAAKIPDSIDIEEIEVECLKPISPMLGDIALALLKLVSSHRGLTHDIFDDQARKQFLAKAPSDNPFGDDEVPAKFSDFDVLTKIRVLQQLTQWTMIHPERIRDKMEEQKDTEQTNWRIEPYGWDADDRTYYVLDDNRVYRLTEAPPSAPTTKPKKSKTYRGGRRSSKRRRTTISTEDELADTDNGANREQEEDDSLGGMTWECVAVTLADVRSVVDGFRKTRDENEKILRSQLEDHLVPILEKQEDGRKRKDLQRERELANLAKMANAKRSSRIAGKIEQQKQEERAKDEEKSRRQAEVAKRREEATNLKMERERDTRLISREKRQQERDARRRQHEDELAQLSEDGKSMTASDGRISERRLQAEIERNKLALKELEQEEEDWVFDCLCGLYGQVDDGTHSVACEKCNIWQHSKCLGITEAEAERPEFQFVCGSCTRHEEAKARPRTTIKLKVTHPHSPRGQGQPAQQSSNTPAPKAVKISPKSSVPAGGINGQALNDASMASSSANGSILDGVAPSPNSMLGTPQPVLSTPRAIPIIPAPIKLDAGETDRQHQAGNPQQSATAASPTASVRTASPSSSFQSLSGGRSFESALSTPKISRDIYRAAYVQNGTLPAQAGISPTKHSPLRPTDPGSANKISVATPILPPVASLSPSPRPQVLTPPSKPSEPPRRSGSPSAKP